jgi:NAD(P)-dependent dehydrogenase (short-subunit alcohol dehydrogenase family)|tara:strand:+ start:75 stop:950 length:876 start_codon:yes stop_codon:yes gene_type:complete
MSRSFLNPNLTDGSETGLFGVNNEGKVAVVIGVGDRNGLGGAIAYRIAQAGYHVVMCGRTQKKMDDTKANIEKDTPGSASAIVFECIGPSAEFGVAATDGNLMESEVVNAFKFAQTKGTIDLVVQNQGPNMIPPDGRDMRNMSSGFIKYMWENNMLISFLVGREAARVMVKGDGGKPCGSLIFTGATGGLRGKPPFIAFAQGKAGVRFLAQSMGREFGPKGLHVAHVIIDGAVDGARLHNVYGGKDNFDKKNGKWGGLNVDHAANAFFSLHKQHPSAWTHEIELRPWVENW